jgi:hypothetical protein
MMANPKAHAFRQKVIQGNHQFDSEGAALLTDSSSVADGLLLEGSLEKHSTREHV